MAAETLREAFVAEMDEFDVDEERIEEALDVVDAWDLDDDAEEDDAAADETPESIPWDSGKHPRAAAGAAGGGQFAAGGGSSAPGKKATGTAHKTATVKKGPQSLSYDAKSGRGAGYGRPGGDPRVRKLQTSLNRLGLKDGSGHTLKLDGKLGPRTTAAVKAAQRKLGLPADGKVTPQLLAKLTAAKSLTKKAKAPHVKVVHPKAAPKVAPKAAAAPVKTHKTIVKESDVDQPEGTFETLERIAGRVLEAKGADDNGGRIFRVQIIEAGDSKNARRYPQQVLAEGARLYEGAKAYDHHRTAAELSSSTISGLVGSYRNVEATSIGLEGDLHLLPGSTHVAEALDASLEAQGQGLPPLVGISHDAMTYTRPITVGGRRMQEAVRIAKVHSADVVADPAAGGKAVRVLAGGIEETDPETSGESNEEDDVALTSQSVLAALKDASPEELAAVGLSKAPTSTETAPAAEPEPVTESTQLVDKASFLGSLMIREKVAAAGLPLRVAESLAEALPDRLTESAVDAQIASLKTALGMIEREGLAPTVTAVVTQESQEKKTKALDAFFAGDFQNGYRSFKEAFIDITGRAPRAAFDEDFNRVVMRESVQSYDSGDRTTESLSASSWNLVLGDSITRRLVAEYNQPDLQNWRQITSSIVPVNDFRTQRIDRIGGYGLLPDVAAGAPYQPLPSPGNEESTYALTKKGGTEDVTLEMIANDDVRAISKIPTKLGLAAANRLYQFVWNFITTAAGTATTSGGSTTYDSSSLFTGTSGHANYVANGAGSALSQSALSAGRLLMRSQTAYGDTSQFIAPTPRFLIVVNDIEELGWQLVTSAVALPTAANTPPQSTGAANTPNLHQNLNLIVLDYIANATSTTAWWLAADPGRIPTLEVGFYQGQQDPALFTQSDPTVGSVFNADKVTYKIRHIYSGAILDHRGFVKGNV